tara:strand:+ start:132 stop:962 length:831 start_codon:yes stop_codon:yes gene_type:complete
MKFLKKASLAASIAAVSFAANAELVAMDEMAMAATTGQAGVDIDITLQGTEAISIGGILYRDTDTDGGVLVDGVTLGAADGGEVELTNAIDINADGSIQIVGNTEAQSLVLGIGSVDTVTSAYTTGAADGVNIMGASTIYMNVIGGTTTIRDQADDADTEFNEAGTVISMSGGSVEVTSVDGQSTDVSLLNNAISLGGLKVYGNGGEGTGISTNADILFNDSGVTITNVDLAGTIEIQQLGLGANTGTAENPNNVIGSLAISDIALNGAKITISGR